MKDAIKVNYQKAVKIAKAAIGMFERREYPFNQTNLFPDAIVPQGITQGSLEHSLFLFYACNFDSSQRATIVYESLRNVAENLDFSLLPLMSAETVASALAPYMKKIGDPEKTLLKPGEIIAHNSRKLAEEYGGDPRNLAARTIEQTLYNIQHGRTRHRKPGLKFRQYGPGKAALLMKNFVRFGIWDFPETDIPIKIDRHLIRISVGAGVLELPTSFSRGRIDRAVELLTQVYLKVTRREGISAVALNDAFWAIGSNSCVRNDDIFCHTHCRLGCTNRPKIDEKLTWYYPQTEHRTDVDNLFRHAKETSS